MDWMDGMKGSLNERGMSVMQRRMIVCDEGEWRTVVNA